MLMRSGLAGSPAGAPRPMAAPRPDDAVCFEAATPQGALVLRVAANAAPPRHAADAAILLHGCEPLLTALDDWADAPLAWRWVLAPAAAVRAGADWHGGRARLECPWRWLRARPAPEEDAGLAWAALPASLVAARLRLSAEEIDALEPGGALIVPQSLLPSWHGVLRAADETETIGPVVALAGVAETLPAAPRLAPGFDAAAALAAWGDAGELVELRLDLPGAIAADRLAGWRDGPIGPAGPLAQLWRCEAGRTPARRIACGRLMPWGDGWALAIESLVDHPRSA